MKPRRTSRPATRSILAPPGSACAQLALLSLAWLLATAASVATADERAIAPPRIDWGGGYFKGGDPASSTVATSGAAQRDKAAKAAPAPTAAPPRTDWGGGYFKGGDSASNTPATSGAADRNGKR